MSGIKILNVGEDNCTNKKELILSEFKNLNPGESFILVNNVDPQPLLQYLSLNFSEEFSFEYLETNANEIKIKMNKNKIACCGCCGNEN